MGTSDVFTNQLVPLAKSLAGSLSPWEGLSKEQVQKLVDKIYGPEEYTVQDAPMDLWGPLVSHLFIYSSIHLLSWTMLMRYLNIQISYRLNNWRNGFGTKAAEALKRYIEVDQAKFFYNHQVIADWVQFYLTADGNPPTYPFLYKEWRVNDETGKVSKKVCKTYHI